MRAASAALSITVHVTLGAALVWGAVDVRTPQTSRPRIAALVPYHATPSTVAPTVPSIDANVSLPPVPFPTIVPDRLTPLGPEFDVRPRPGAPAAGGPVPAGAPLDVSLADEPPVMLAGPVPAYPELLRQAGVQGRVVLEVVVDTAGRVEPGSFVVVSAAHPAFVASAQRTLAAALFRPARVHGRGVRVRVSIPIDFVLRDGRLGGR
jgi:periplasmic protein TonB